MSHICHSGFEMVYYTRASGSKWVALVGLILSSVFDTLNTLDNGLVLTPPMGWLAWERFRCVIDCKNDPENCISENLFMEMARRVAADGFREAGYEYIIIDDCWMTTERDSKGRLQADPERFPHGIKYIADFVHSLGLKLGIYQDIGTKTCIGYPGSQGFEKIDVDTFAEWDVDYFKLDGCYKDPREFDQAYPMVGDFIKKTGRKIVYSCSWPAYQVEHKLSVNWTAIRYHCNLWRNYGDIQDSYDSITDIIQWFATNQDALTSVAGPGSWNDPGMIFCGASFQSCVMLYIDSRHADNRQPWVIMAIWAILASPLMMSNDLRSLRPEFKEILLNKDIIQIDQDPLGIQGRQILAAMQGQGVEVWRRPVMPVTQVGNETWASFAVVCWNRRVDGTAFMFSRPLSFYGLTHPGGYYVKELFTQQDFGLLKANDILNWKISPSGSVVMWKATLAVASSDSSMHEYKNQESALIRDRLKVTSRLVDIDSFALRRSDRSSEQTSATDIPVLLQFIMVVGLIFIIFRLAGVRFGVSSVMRAVQRMVFFIRDYFSGDQSGRNGSAHLV